MSSYNRNPTGKNQHGGIRESYTAVAMYTSLTQKFFTAAADDQALLAAFNTYHREKLTNNSIISERLLKEHNIRMRYVSKARGAPFFLM